MAYSCRSPHLGCFLAPGAPGPEVLGGRSPFFEGQWGLRSGGARSFLELFTYLCLWLFAVVFALGGKSAMHPMFYSVPQAGSL